MARIAGMTEDEVKQLNKKKTPVPVDGPNMKAAFWSHFSLGVSPDGRTIYGGNGDEHVLRRIKDGKCMTLFKDGWKSVEEGRNQGWFIGGPIFADADGRIYLSGNNPPEFLRFRRLVPAKKDASQ